MRVSNIFHKGPRRHLLIYCLLSQSLFAQHPAAVESTHQPLWAAPQYIRDDWDASRGYSGGRVYGITQSSDGYLWIGSEKGLVRFDGLTFQPFQETAPSRTPLGAIFGLAGDSDGNLWVSLPALKRLHSPNGALEEAPPVADQPPDPLSANYREKDGTLLFSTVRRGIFGYRAGRFEQLSGAPSDVVSAAQTPDGTLWMGTADAGLYRYAGGQTTVAAPIVPHVKVNCLLPFGEHGLWMGTDTGVVRWDGAATAGPAGHFKALVMLEDRESTLWIGAADGLYRLQAGSDPASLNFVRYSDGTVTALFEDREGDLWVGGPQGIARIKPRVFATYSSTALFGTSTGLASQTGGPLFADSQGSVWFGPGDGGLLRLQNGRTDRVNPGLGTDIVYSLAGGVNELWIGRQQGGLTHLQLNGASMTSKTYSAAEGLPARPVYSVHRNADGTVWAGTLNGGVAKVVDGRITVYTTADGLLSNTVAAIEETSDGTMWFATPNGINSLSKGSWRAITVQNGLPPGSINCLTEDSAGVLWIGSDQGLAYIRAGRAQIPRQLPQPLREPILGIQPDSHGWLWVATSNHVLRVQRDRLLSDSVGEPILREYGRDDGLPAAGGVKRNRSVIADGRGRIWFSMAQAIAVVDPAHLQDTSAPALVHIQELSADGNRLTPGKDLAVPPGPRRIVLSFTGLNLDAPEHIKFRYRLDGYDPDWSEPTATREAPYTNLGPGPYRFHVMASNAEGLWNGGESTLAFRIEPALWQATWFRLSCIAVCTGAIVALYRFRLHSLAGQLNIRFEERLSERTRIARELHDTLLQSFQGLMLRFQAVHNMLPQQALQAKESLGIAIDRAAEAITEGRDAVQELRSGGTGSNDLVQALTSLGQELGTNAHSDDGKPPASFGVLVEGTPRQVHPLLRDDLYRISREAVRNAFRHSRANRIEVEIRYDERMLRLRVRDDGDGIDPSLLAEGGREGHWGLPGMRERARSIGGEFEVWSELRQGTEVEVTIPGSVAYRGGARDAGKEEGDDL